MKGSAVVALFAALHAQADEYTHTYDVGEAINLWVNKVGPYHNPQETYMYYSLPFCAVKPVDQLEHRYDWLGEVLEGNDLISSGLAMHFRAGVPEHTKVCSMVLDADSVAQFEYAVTQHYWYVQGPAPQACGAARRRSCCAGLLPIGIALYSGSVRPCQKFTQ
jgi:transmembrane 9 superfamily protein 3